MKSKTKSTINRILGFLLLGGGLAIAAWGWDKTESTIEARTHGGVTMIVVGLLMFFVPIIYLFVTGWSGKKG